MNIKDKEHLIRIYQQLQKIAKTLHTLDEGDCNGRISEQAQQWADTRTDNLMKKAQELANMIGLKAFHQSDPRGASLYLVESLPASNNYTNGIAVY